MQHSRVFLLLALTLAAGACGDSSGGGIDNELERQLSAVAGPWTGVSPELTLDFQLQDGAGTAVSGSGTMKEAAAASTVPITVTGTFQRPQLSLTVSGMTFEGRAVQAAFQGSYTTVGGISAPLHLTATGYSRDISILLQER
ncbi:MAG TPA: hypothetical protein VF647_04215 [Longimicrobium sp.]|jgi:hypothetical protein